MGASKNGQRIMCSVICTPPVEPAARRGWGIKALEIQKRHPKGCLLVSKMALCTQNRTQEFLGTKLDTYCYYFGFTWLTF